MFFNKPQSVSKKDKIKAREFKKLKDKILFKEYETMKSTSIDLSYPAVKKNIKSNKERCDERNKVKYASTR